MFDYIHIHVQLHSHIYSYISVRCMYLFVLDKSAVFATFARVCVVLQGVAGCCSVLQCVAVCYRVLQSVLDMSALSATFAIWYIYISQIYIYVNTYMCIHIYVYTYMQSYVELYRAMQSYIGLCRAIQGYVHISKIRLPYLPNSRESPSHLHLASHICCRCKFCFFTCTVIFFVATY